MSIVSFSDPTPPPWLRYPESAEDGMACVTETYVVWHWQKHGARRYTRDWLKQYDGEPYVMFWKPGESATPACLGQWQPSAFMVNRLPYCCAEQYMMAEKARLFGDSDIVKRIMATDDPPTMKHLGKLVQGFDASTWDHAKHSIVLNGNYAKFSQDETLRNYLLSTKDTILVEASPLDTIWGIGLGASNDRAYDVNKWRGQNLLGFALMEVRDEIARVWANADLIDWHQFDAS